MLEDRVEAQEIDLADIARGRRITAVAASELELVPRRSIRPKRPGAITRVKLRLIVLLRSVAREL